MNYSIDTDTVIYSLKGVASVVESFRIRERAPKAISVITYGELVYGAKESQWEEQNMARMSSCG